MAEYYKAQRRRLNLLMEDGAPVGGKWSFDEDNRKKVPKKLLSEIPAFQERAPDEIDQAARIYVERQFAENYGTLDTLTWPTSHEGAAQWLQTFLDQRFEQFGTYEDAIVEGESLLWHSALTPMLNIGLITPHQIIDAVQEHVADARRPTKLCRRLRSPNHRLARIYARYICGPRCVDADDQSLGPYAPYPAKLLDRRHRNCTRR